MNQFRLLVLSTLFLWPVATNAQPISIPVTTTVDQRFKIQGEAIEYLDDPEGVLKIDSFLTNPEALPFKSLAQDIPNLGLTDHVSWFKVTIENQSSISDWVLGLGYPLLDSVDLFLVRDGKIEKRIIGGDHLPFSERHRPHATLNFGLQLAQGSSQIFIRVQSEGSTQLPLELYTQPAFGQYMVENTRANFIYIGILLVMIVFNTLLVSIIRDPAYAFYVGYLAFCLCSQMALTGTSFQLLWPNTPFLINIVFGASGHLAAAMFAGFSILFLQIKRTYPPLFKPLQSVTAIILLLALLSPFLPYRVVIRTLVTSLALGIPLVFYAGIRVYAAGYKPARYFLVSFLPLGLGIVAYAFSNIGILPNTPLTDHGVEIGSALEVTLLSLALADRYQLLQKQKTAAQSLLIESLQGYRVELVRRAELEETNDALQKEITAATEQLIQADKLSSLGQMVAGVAHDIASPTQFIQTTAELSGEKLADLEDVFTALLTNGDPEAEELLKNLQDRVQVLSNYATRILQGTTRISALNNALRNYSRTDPQFETNLNLEPLVAEALMILGSKLNGIEIHSECGSLLPFIGRRSQVSQVLANLISNAADAIRDQTQKPEAPYTGKLSLTAQLTSANETEGILIHIDDNGAGISEENKKKILEPFFTTKGVHKGTGLGLTIVQKIMAEHKGTLSIAAGPNEQGTRMSVWFPLDPTSPTPQVV